MERWHQYVFNYGPILLLVLSLVISITTAKGRKDVQIPAKSLGRHKESGVNYANFKAHKNSYLKLDKVGVKVATVHTLKDCAMACVNNYFCLSLNIAIRPDKHGHFVCEILAGDKYNNSSNFSSSEDFHHYSIATSCLNNPCKNGASCIPRYQDDTYTCVCRPGYVGKTCKDFADCTAIKNVGIKENGTYLIYPDDSGPVSVYCDMLTNGSGWTVIQRRIDGSIDFYLNWTEYKRGFGTPSGEFWLGNDNIHRLTASGNTVLRVELEDWRGNTAHAEYGTFMVDDESNKYKLNAGSYSGTAGDCFKDHNGMFFSTKDRDNDQRHSSCARDRTGAWWYHNCASCNLNGRYLGNTESRSGVGWYYWKLNWRCVKRSTMMIRRPL